MVRVALVAFLMLVTALAAAADRDARQRAAFMRENPCPLTGKARGACPGYEVDHVRPLCAGGGDHPRNMQWLTVQAHREKTRVDVRECRAARRMPR